MKTKILAMLFLVLTIVFIVTACGDSTSTGNNNGNNSNNGGNSNEHIHSWIEATCMSPKTCDSCGQTQGTVVAHSWSEATCVSAKTCSYCGIESGSVSTTNHNYGDWQVVNELSCTTNGLEKRVCSWCQNEETQTETAQGHNFVSGVCETCGNKEKLTVRDILYLNKEEYYEWYLGVENEAGELTNANVEITAEILNNNVSVYKKVFNVSVDDFVLGTRTNGDVELRAKIVINKSEITAGINATGTFKFTFKGENGSNLTSSTKNVSLVSGLPQVQATVILPSTPRSFYYRAFGMSQLFKLTDITYEAKGTDLYLYFSGTKEHDSEGSSTSRVGQMGYKLYDSNGYVVASGNVYITALSTGDSFKNECEIIWGKITPGETYTLEILSVE